MVWFPTTRFIISRTPDRK